MVVRPYGQGSYIKIPLRVLKTCARDLFRHCELARRAPWPLREICPSASFCFEFACFSNGGKVHTIPPQDRKGAYFSYALLLGNTVKLETQETTFLPSSARQTLPRVIPPGLPYPLRSYHIAQGQRHRQYSCALS